MIYLVVTHNACITPGMKTNKHRRMFISKSLPTPFLRKTATGGKNIASIIKSTLFMLFAPVVAIKFITDNALIIISLNLIG